MRRLIALKYATGCIAAVGLPLSLLTMTPAFYLQMLLPAVTLGWVALSWIALAALAMWVVCAVAVFVVQALLRNTSAAAGSQA